MTTCDRCKKETTQGVDEVVLKRHENPNLVLNIGVREDGYEDWTEVFDTDLCNNCVLSWLKEVLNEQTPKTKV